MKKTMTFMIALILICGFSIPAFAAGSETTTKSSVKEQTQSQTQDQTRDRLQDQSCQQTETSAADCEHARLQVRDRLQISSQAETQYQVRAQQQQQTQSSFTDTEQHWARAQINSAYCWGLINGYPGGGFGPNDNISGTEGVLMVSRLMSCLNGENNSGTTEDSIDWNLVPEWAKAQLQEKNTLRIAAQSQCYGEQKVNRLQFAVMLAEAAGIEPADVSADTVVFLDQSEISAEDLGYIEALRTLGVIEGNDGCFYANQTVTRAEAAVMLTRMLEIVE